MHGVSSCVMEVLLLQDINGVGKKDDLLVVGDGYALNHLLPQGIGMIATPTVRRRFAEQIRRRAEAAEAERSAKETKAEAAADKTITFKRKVTKTGKLYAAITEKHIAQELKKQHEIEIKEKAIKIAEPIKETGSFEVTMKIAEEEQPLKVVVKEEK